MKSRKMGIKNRLILLILFFFIFLRLYGLYNPLTDYIGLRQVPTADIAKNFYEKKTNILYPQYSIKGGEGGYIEIEFQILPYITAKLYKIFGFHEIIGRIVAVMFSLAGFIFLYLLLNELMFDRMLNLSIMLIYSILPQNIYLSRCFMPEPVMLAFITAFIYFAVKLQKTGKMLHAFFAVLTGALAILSKAPAAYILAVFIPLLFLRKGRLKFRVFVIPLLIFLILVPPFLYYYHSYKLGKAYQSVGIWETGHGHISKWADTETLTGKIFWGSLIKRLFEYSITPVLLPFFLAGIFLSLKGREYILLFWFMGVISSFFILAKGTIANPYYLFPITPLIAIFSGIGIQAFLKYFRRDIFYIIIISILFIYSCLYIKDFYKCENVTLRLGRKLSEISKPEDRVLTVLHSSLYYSRRYGFMEKALSKIRLEFHKENGVKWFGYPLGIYEKYDRNTARKLSDLSEVYKVAFLDDDFIIFDLMSESAGRLNISGQEPDRGHISGLAGTKEDILSMRIRLINRSESPILMQIEREGRIRGFFSAPAGISVAGIKMPAYPHLHYVKIGPRHSRDEEYISISPEKRSKKQE